MASDRLFNFSAGPAVLPLEVLEEIQEELPVYKDAGASIIEISHRSPQYTSIAESARSLMRSLLGIGDEWHILFLQGGASLQFHQVALNFLSEDTSADYLNTGNWSRNAIKEAKAIGRVNVAASSEETNFDRIPSQEVWHLDAHARYLHFTSNNTIYGTRFPKEPPTEVPLVCDASSDFLSRPIDTDKYGLIYAGAQKNVGPAGATIVLIKDTFLQSRNSSIPTILDYGTHAAKLFHTPPVFGVYVVEKVLAWLDKIGGLEKMEALNNQKAAKLYSAIDNSDFYKGSAKLDGRSIMNVCFSLTDDSRESEFLSEAKDRGLINLKGHRSTGGFRASIYNACPNEAVDALVDFMSDFERAS